MSEPESNAKVEEVGDDETFVLGDSIEGSESAGEVTGEDQEDASDDPVCSSYLSNFGVCQNDN